jgi:hypothetical protein
MKRRQRLLSTQADDRGAALLLVLIVVTVVALVGAATLSLAQTSLRTTVALRDQGAGAYAAEGAAQVAISELQAGRFPNNCATLTGDALPLGSGTQPFYQSAQSSSTPLNAYVSCVPDPSSGTGGIINSANKPANAIWTVRSDAYGVGQNYNHNSGKTINVANGNVISETSIDIGSNMLAVTGTNVKVLAKSQSGCMSSQQGQFLPTPCVPNGTLDPRPSYPAPTDTVLPAPAPVCTAGSPRYAAFSPGLYTNVDILNGTRGTSGNLNICGAADVVWFMPGTYYFDFTGTWNAPSRLVGGTPTDSTGAQIAGLSAATLGNLSRLNPATSGACVDPRQGSAAPGVQFVFGGASNVNLGSHVFEICATYSAGRVPVAIFGPIADILNGGGSNLAVTTQRVCSVDACSMLSTDTSGQAEFHIQGFVYAPNARIALVVKNSPGQMFNWGVLLGSFSLTVNGASPTQPFLDVPASDGSASYSVMYLNVWVCPATASSCDSSSGPARLTAKVQTAPPATVRVLSWSVQR